jgi:hypothetical protein
LLILDNATLIQDLTLLQEQGRHLRLIVKNGAVYKQIA